MADPTMCDSKALQTDMHNDYLKQADCPKRFGVFQVAFRITWVTWHFICLFVSFSEDGRSFWRPCGSWQSDLDLDKQGFCSLCSVALLWHPRTEIPWPQCFKWAWACCQVWPSGGYCSLKTPSHSITLWAAWPLGMSCRVAAGRGRQLPHYAHHSWVVLHKTQTLVSFLCSSVTYCSIYMH